MTKEEEPNWLGTLWNVDKSLAKMAEKYLEDQKKSDFEFLDQMAVENEKKNARIRELEDGLEFAIRAMKSITILPSLKNVVDYCEKSMNSEPKQLLNQKP